MRHRRPAGHVARRGGHRRVDGRRRRRRRPARRRALGGRCRERQDVAWRHRPDDLSPFSRGRARASRASGLGVARLGSKRRASRRPVDRDPQARLAAPEGEARPGGVGAQAHARASSASSRCARTPAARTCRSAGPTARRRSWCSATAAPGRAGSASSTPASRCRPPPTSRRASPRPSTGWTSTTPCSRWSPATTSPTAAWPTSPRASRRSGCAARRHASRR